MFKALFDEQILLEPSDKEEKLIGSFLHKWVSLEKGLIMYSEFIGDAYGRTPNLRAGVGLLVEEGKMNKEIYEEIISLSGIRNAVVHGQIEPSKAITTETLERLEKINEWLKVECPEYKGA